MPSPIRLAAALAMLVVGIGCVRGDQIERALPRGSSDRVEVRVLTVTDGDTIRVDLDGVDTPVRLIGVDTPERDGPFTVEECFGSEASTFVAGAVGGRIVALEFDVDRIDPYDRILAYVWLDGELLNERILREGYGVLATFPPNVRYVDRFRRAERQARDRDAGLWGACSTR